MKSSTECIIRRDASPLFHGFSTITDFICEKNASLDSPKENRTLTTFVIDLKRLAVYETNYLCGQSMTNLISNRRRT